MFTKKEANHDLDDLYKTLPKWVVLHFNPSLHKEEGRNDPPGGVFADWSERPQILVQFIFDIENLWDGSLEPKGCPKKNLEHDFWSKGLN